MTLLWIPLITSLLWAGIVSEAVMSFPEEHPDNLVSGVYTWPNQWEDHAPGVKLGAILEGSTTALERLAVHGYQLDPEVSHFLVSQPGQETLLIIKSGTVEATLGERAEVLTRGSVAVLFQKNALRLVNTGDKVAEYYQFKYQSRSGVDDVRSAEAGSSLLVDVTQLEMTPTSKGARRHYFDQPTPTLDRFEMHVTSLNEGLASHGVHTHREEEFLLIMDSTVEEHIDGTLYPAKAGDLIFLDAMVPHTITSTGTGPALYFAFKWE